MNKIRDRLERSLTALQCNPSLVILVLLVVLCVFVYHYRGVILLTIEVTLIVLASLLIMTGAALIGHAVYRTRHARQAPAPLPASAPKPRKVAGQDAEPMIREADKLSRSAETITTADLPKDMQAKM